MTFHVGDIVKLKGGSGHQKVTRIETNNRVSTKYVSSTFTQINRRAGDFELVKPKPQPIREDRKKMSKLFKVLTAETETYGTYLTDNSEGKLVLEIRGTCDVLAFDLKDLEEVVPFTVLIQFANGQNHHYTVPKDSLKIGDLVVDGINLGRVTELDTKRDNAKRLPKGLERVGTAALTV